MLCEKALGAFRRLSAQDALADRRVIVVESGIETAIIDGRSIGAGIGREP
jgi:hypothetical protein